MTTNPDLRTVREDDRLLDRLGRGEPVRGDDVEAMLAAWRRTLPAAGPPEPPLLAAVTRKPAPKRRLTRTSVGIAASFVLVGGGVTTAAAFAQPDSPLWPVTRFVYGDLADSRQALAGANHAVSDARTAIEQGRYADAARLLATADALADDVDSAEATQLREEISGMRDRLPAGTNVPANAPDGSKPSGSHGGQPPSADSEPTDGPEREPAPEPGAGEDPSGGGPADEPNADQPDDPPDDQPEVDEPPNHKPEPPKGKPQKPK
jgi:hypothetical protein